MKKSLIIILTIWWGIIGILLFSSLIILSVYKEGSTGWSLIASGDLDWLHVNNVPSGDDNWMIFLHSSSMVLFVAVPILSLIGIVMTVKMVLAIKRPKSIEFIDALNNYKKVHKKSKKEIQKNQKLLDSKKITSLQFNSACKSIENRKELVDKKYLELKVKWQDSWKNKKGKNNVENQK